MIELIIITLAIMMVAAFAVVIIGWFGVLGFLAYKLIKELFNS